MFVLIVLWFKVCVGLKLLNIKACGFSGISWRNVRRRFICKWIYCF